jgi:phosphorylated adapter RNA export protein
MPTAQLAPTCHPSDRLTTRALAAALQEPRTVVLARAIKVLGPERCADLLIEVLHLEAAGGLLTRDGTRRRTPGGLFFGLLKQRCTPQEQARLFGRCPRQ